jgi:hypothetical protein
MRAPIELSLAAAAGLLLGLSFALPTWAVSLEERTMPGIPSDRDTIVVVRGVIEEGDHRRFRELLDLVNPDLVMMESPGGFAEDALLMAEEIHHRGLKTFIGPEQACVSGCAFMFLSGRDKYLTNSSGLGLHASADQLGNANPYADTLIAQELARFGVPTDIIAKMNSTKPSDIWWLGKDQQDALGITLIAVGGE